MTNRGPFAPGLPPWSSKDSFARMAPTGKGNVPLSAATSAFRFTKVNTCRLPCVALSTGASFTFRHVLYCFAVAVATGSCPGTGCAASAPAVRTPATARAIRSLGTMRHPPVGAYFAGEETGRPVGDIPRLSRARARGRRRPGNTPTDQPGSVVERGSRMWLGRGRGGGGGGAGGGVAVTCAWPVALARPAKPGHAPVSLPTHRGCRQGPGADAEWITECWSAAARRGNRSEERRV